MIELSWQADKTCAVIALDRPGKANALTEQMLIDINAALDAARRAKVLILTGRGKVFSAGADLDAMVAGLGNSPLWEQASGKIERHRGLTIAALNGTAAGGTLGMVFVCDIRVAVEGAQVFYPVMKRGFLPQRSDPKRLAALVGPSRAKQILMLGRRITGPVAQEWGLIDDIVPAGTDVVAHALHVAEDCVNAKPEILSGIKGYFGG